MIRNSIPSQYSNPIQRTHNQPRCYPTTDSQELRSFYISMTTSNARFHILRLQAGYGGAAFSKTSAALAKTELRRSGQLEFAAAASGTQGRRIGGGSNMVRLYQQLLDPTRSGREAEQLEASLRSKIIGQDQAIRQIVSVYQTFLAGMNSPGRPIGNFLFLGPTGAGKNRAVEATAESLVGMRAPSRSTARGFN